ncbi:hypothetical protein H7J71_25245 [Mycolicibacterium peregrinum]|uniref:DUF7257 domain-containing protein n=1 Tax=Mycolicibacterium peregrinum TaxID=43304 RepID=UPI0006D78002|nr:hypothetical protein [Mycolicibacterium peregrinum]MCV7205314.1 hypothetical protein [Mycolicibacterium peregrinum]ORW54790.1 hypothetical protein AWC21_23895 [Mycolicibacterium peregrinum]
MAGMDLSRFRGAQSASINSGGGSYDQRIPDNDHDPTRNALDWTDPMGAIADAAGEVGEQIRNAFVFVVRELTGIDLSSWDAFIASLDDGKGIDLPFLVQALQVVAAIFGGIDFTDPPTAEEVWTAVATLFLAPLNLFAIPADVQADINTALGNMKDALDGTYTGSGPIFLAIKAAAAQWLTATSPLNAANVFGRFGLGQFGGGVPLNALTAAVSNELEPFRAASELPATGDGDRDGWSFNAAEDAAQVVCDGSPKALYLKSGVIKVESGQPLDTSVKVKYSGVTSGAGQTIRLVLDTFTTDDGSGSATPVTVGAISNPSGTITTPVSLGDSSWDIPTGVKSVRPVLECDELITAGTVFWKNTPELFKELAGPLADGLVPALDNAGQAIRDAIANALGHSGTGHTSANILTYLQSIPQTVVSGLTDLNTLTNQIRDIFAGIVVTPINSTVQAIKDWFNGVVGKTQNLTSGGNLPPSNVGSPTGGTNIGQDILDTLNGIWAGLRGAGSASGKTATDVAAATAATADLVTQVSSIAARLDTSVTQVIRGGGGGATDQFEREDANLGADWDSTNTGVGAIATNGSAAYWEPVGGSAATQIARNALVETATNFQKVSFVLTEPLNTVSGWMLLGRMNSAKTTYVYMFAKKDYREIGYVNGGSPVVLASSSDPFDPPPGAKISGHFGVNFYGVVDEDAFSLGDYPGYGNSLNVNSSAPSKGDTYRSMGMGAKVSTASGAQVSPGALELWTGGDSKSPPTVGVHLDVDTPVSFTALSSSGPYFSSGFFSVSRQSDFITFDPTTTAFTVELPGAYQVFAQLELSAALATGNTMELLLISPSVHSERSMRALAGMVSVQMSPVVYLEAGDSVRLAYTTAGAGSKSVVGSLRVAKLSPPYFA